MESVDQLKQQQQHDSPSTRATIVTTAATAGDTEYSEVLLDEPDHPELLTNDEDEPRIVIHENNKQSLSSSKDQPADNSDNHVAEVQRGAGQITAPVTKESGGQADDTKSGSGSSSASSPIPASPHKTRFTVTVRHGKECTGDIITYSVSSKRLSTLR